MQDVANDGIITDDDHITEQSNNADTAQCDSDKRGDFPSDECLRTGRRELSE